ncbi:ornithine aminotransferase [Francisella halioticida]|uniref:ornithine aminotransferase n=1 Tax=Francisella halioticida TaxID=549298 RepID=A0ABM6LY07_9GAMM|nr:ornithine--oxo-acid transaminase [Francisella halioticida]ASG67413.1 ornithine--oxo-acid transaminase [Francisella halioticida]BCD92603.1 ornithine aminotransferase [Francisella halioticida]
MQTTINTTEQYGANIIVPAPITIVKGDNAYVYDDSGKRYIDMSTGISSVNFGHNNPKILEELFRQANKISIVPRLFHNKPLAKLFKKACNLTNMDKAIAINSGAEAIETAIKVARKWGYIKKQIPDGLAEIITFDNSFHGRTITAIGTSSNPAYKEKFGPMTQGFISIPFNDLDTLQKTISKNTAAIIIEPIQGEGGIVIPDSEYLYKCQKICKENNVLFILDEIQTGMGRTGKNFAKEYYNLDPDGMTLGKSLGGGVLPISLFLGKNELMDVLHPGDHGSTFGGNPLASAIAYKALSILDDEALAERAETLGSLFIGELKKINSKYIQEIRAKGLFIALQIYPQYFDSFYQELLNSGVLAVKTRNNSIRFLPPLTISEQTILDAIQIMKNLRL